jgi:hypothetical protein
MNPTFYKQRKALGLVAKGLVCGLLGLSGAGLAFKPTETAFGHRMIVEELLQDSFNFNNQFFSDAGRVFKPVLTLSDGRTIVIDYAPAGKQISHGVMLRDFTAAAGIWDIADLNKWGSFQHVHVDCGLDSTSSSYHLEPAFADARTRPDYFGLSGSDRCNYYAGDNDVYETTGDIYGKFAHCDDNAVYECANAIRYLRQKAYEALKIGAGSNDADVKRRSAVKARLYIGKAIHTLQDFYAHSNFPELYPDRLKLFLPLTDYIVPVSTIGKKYGELVRSDFEKLVDLYGFELGAANESHCDDSKSLPSATTVVLGFRIYDPTLSRNDGNWDIKTKRIVTGHFDLNDDRSGSLPSVGNTHCDHGQYKNESIVSELNVSGIAKDIPGGALRPSRNSSETATRQFGWYSHDSAAQEGSYPPKPASYTLSTAIASASPEHATATVLAAKHTKLFLEEFARFIIDKSSEDQVSSSTADSMIKLFAGSENLLPLTYLLVDRTGTSSDFFASVVSQSLLSSFTDGDKGLRLVYFDVVNSAIGETVKLSFADTDGSRGAAFSDLGNAKGKGGGDCREPYYTALFQLLKQIPKNSTVNLFTDAAPSDPELADSMRLLATSKNIKTDITALGSCSPIDPAYFQTSSGTGGRFTAVEPTSDGIESALQMLDLANTGKAAAQMAHFESATLPNGNRSVSIPVDTQGKSLRITLNAFGGALKLFAPDGRDVALDATTLTTKTLNTIDILVSPSVVGVWRAELSPSVPAAAGARYTLSAAVVGGPILGELTYRYGQEIGRQMHEYAPEVAVVLPAAKLQFETELSTEVQTASLQYISVAGDILSESLLTKISATSWRGDVVPPTANHRIKIIGDDLAGAKYARIYSGELAKAEVTGGRFLLTPLQGIVGAPGDEVEVLVRVQNFGTDDGFVGTFNPSSVTVVSSMGLDAKVAGQGASVIKVRVRIPAGAKAGDSVIPLTILSNSGRTVSADVPFQVRAADEASVKEIPTLGHAGLLVLSLALVALAASRQRRKRETLHS